MLVSQAPAIYSLIMADLYPPLEPYASGMLDVEGGHQVYWEMCGKPAGKPALVLHGGPGSGCTPGDRRCFDPEVYRIVLFDQRGSGRSTAHASEPDIDLATNTTAFLIADIEKLRQHLGIERWLVLGGSWGSTLALAYAERYPERVTEMVLYSIATTTAWEIDWITRGVGIFFPEAWRRFCDGVPEAERNGCLVDAYHRLLMSPDPLIQQMAARDWCDWEMAIVAVHPDHKPHPRYEDPSFRLGFAHLVTHYWRHNGWLEDGVLVREAGRLASIPGILIHGRLDIGGPLITPWRLRERWPGSTLALVGEAGHDARDPGMSERIVAATDRFAGGVRLTGPSAPCRPCPDFRIVGLTRRGWPPVPARGRGVRSCPGRLRVEPRLAEALEPLVAVFLTGTHCPLGWHCSAAPRGRPPIGRLDGR
jgi:proline iminopeptidase